MRRRAFDWTNASVRRFAEEENPIDKMERIARECVLDAVECGWTGPPFDPIELAAIRGIRVHPNAAISDARVFVVNDNFLIEYNPHKSRGRVNYSIAHEIAHTFFVDCKEKIRNRGVQARDVSDWQLEMLCNIGAAEILMPVGSFPVSTDPMTSIENLLKLRHGFQVSTEALLIRLTKLTSSRMACFAASRLPDSGTGHYRIDYCIGSKSWIGVEDALRRREVVSSVLDECIAIGTTAKGEETWTETEPDIHVEAVALPPYPGSKNLRVVGVIRPTSDVPTVRELEYRLGDAAHFSTSSDTAIVHVVNDRAKSWGGRGFARCLRERYPMASDAYRHWATANPRHHRLGYFHVAELTDNTHIISVIAQAGYGPTKRPRIRYGALDYGLDTVSVRLQDMGVARVQMPRIGSGQAGGNWKIIAGIVDERLVSSGLVVRVYDLPSN